MFLTTPRLLLRPPWPEDAGPLHAALEWEVVRNTATMPWPYTRSDAEEWVARTDGAMAGARFVVASKDGTGQLLGAIGLGRNLLTGETEIGYWVARSAWGRGIASEAGRAMVDFAFAVLGLPELTAGHYVDNPASGRVLARIGFRATGEVIPYPCRARGEEVGSVEYRLTRAEWRP